MKLWRAAIVVLCALILAPALGHAAGGTQAMEMMVARAVRPVMARHGVPGMAVGIVTPGQTSVFLFGVASKATERPVTGDTLFEIGSVSKTFTATLAVYAQTRGKLALGDMASRYLPSLRGTSFDGVSLIHLGTHTAGGFPLQFPDGIANDADLMTYFQTWKPSYAPGTFRTYANPSAGLLGMIAARSMDADFVVLSEGTLFPALGLRHTWLNVPAAEADNYAQGYTDADTPIRMRPGILWAETYGIRTTAGDMARFVAANMGMLDLDPAVRRAVIETHTGYFRIGAMTQDLIWEQYDYPVALKDLRAGNSAKIRNETSPAVALDPPSRPRDDVLIDKTGSTNGFSAYVAFVPLKKIGVVLLANKDFPIAARVTAAFEILTRLGEGSAKD